MENAQFPVALKKKKGKTKNNRQFKEHRAWQESRERKNKSSHIFKIYFISSKISFFLSKKYYTSYKTV